MEVLKKLHIGAKKGQVLNTWLDLGLLDKDNFGGLAGKSTVEPALIKRAILEDSIQSNKRLFMLDIDYRRAYDMVPYFIKEMALRRMGCPDELIKTWMGNDPTRKISIKTPFGLTTPLTPKAGGCAQGAEDAHARREFSSSYIISLMLT